MLTGTGETTETDGDEEGCEGFFDESFFAFDFFCSSATYWWVRQSEHSQLSRLTSQWRWNCKGCVWLHDRSV